MPTGSPTPQELKTDWSGQSMSPEDRSTVVIHLISGVKLVKIVQNTRHCLYLYHLALNQ